MARSRLSTALDEGLFHVPNGAIEVHRPPAGYDLSALPREALSIVTGFRPDADWWEAAGHAVSPEPGATSPALAIVVLPRSKRLARAMVAGALDRASHVVVDGQRTDGVDSLWREARARVGDLPSLAKAHGRLFALAAPSGTFSDWRAPEPERGPDGFLRPPGVFSEDGPDRGSALLAAALPAKLPARLADLGAGWGYLAAAALERDGVERIDLIEAEHAAIRAAEANIADSRARFHWADATRFAPEAAYDAILCNPPFHVGRRGDPGLGRAFIAAAARMLVPSGRLWLVANRHLPYEATLAERFGAVEEIGGDAAFKLYAATRPRR